MRGRTTERLVPWAVVLALACEAPPVGGDARPEDAGMDAAPMRDAGPRPIDGGPAPPVSFTDVTESAGLARAHARPPTCILDTTRACEIDFMTGGAAVGDVDGDGWPDLFVTMLAGPDRLYRNLGDGTFVDVSEQAGLADHARYGNGAAFVDVENDGDLDLYVTTIGPGDDPQRGRYYLFINDGEGHFLEEGIERGVAFDDGLVHAGQSIAVGDYDRDGFADLHVTEWLDRGGVRPHTRLLRNLGRDRPGHFEDATLASGALTFSEACWEGEHPCTSYAFANAFTDLDGDGWPDLLVVADFGRTRMFWNRGDGTFELGLMTQDVGGDENGMGSTVGDIDDDGRLDWFVTSIHDPDHTCVLENCSWGASGNRLYRNLGDRRLVDATDEVGVRESGWGWGTALFDYDNDGDLDLVAATGIDFPVTELDARYHADPTRFWVNDGAGRMTEWGAALGIADTDQGRGLVVFDYDGDGDLDVFVVNNGQPPRLYRNDVGQDRRWLRVRCIGTLSSSEGLGAHIVARAGDLVQLREIGSVSHFLGQSERVAHFGLGHATRVDELEVRWPSGRTTRLTDVATNQVLELVEPD